MKKTVALSAFLLAIPSISYAADDMLAAAMKRIAELEAANKAKDAEINRLKSKPASHIAKIEPAPKKKFSTVQKEIPAQTPISAPTSTTDSELALAGFYVGINGGYGGGDVTTNGQVYLFNNQSARSFSPLGFSTSSTTQRFGGAVAGGQAGYNYITSSNVLLVGEIDFDWADISNNINSSSQSYISYGPGYGTSSNGNRQGLRWIGTARARLGYIIGNILPYLTGGLAFGEASYSLRGATTSFQSGPDFKTTYGMVASGASQKTSVGWSAGAGVDYEISRNLSATTQYLYTQLSPAGIGSASLDAANFRFQTSNSGFLSSTYYGGSSNQLGFHQVRFGLNYHLHMDDAPSVVAAKF